MQNEKSGLDTEEHKLLQAKIKDQEEEIIKLSEELVSTTVDMQKQKRELELTVENLKLAQSQLIQSEKMASVGVLTAGIAHELNNPINFMSGNVHPLQQDMEEVFALLEKYEQTITKNDLGGHFAEVDELKEEMDFSYLIQEIYSLLKGIEEGANRSNEIIKGLRSFSRLDDEA
ncbi:MAG: hypothetical protein DRI97_07255, partial [Bacteroidetes bacterium]